MKRCISIIFLILSIACSYPYACAQLWQPDVLGDGFQMRYVDQGKDYSGPVRSTIVRKQSKCHNGKGILYIHGYNDYFFQKEEANRLVDSCYDFYAVDLRKYGRSITDSNLRFQVRDMREYFPDIDSALQQMHKDGVRDITLMGHSTGGLTAAYYMTSAPDTAIHRLVLNSPFLDWNFSGIKRKVGIPLISGIGKLFPHIKIPQGKISLYAESLLHSRHGEWNFNTAWKTEKPLPVESSWVRAITKAQSNVRKHGDRIKVPVLLVHSDHSIYGDEWSEDFTKGDAVLNVDHISKIGKKLGKDVTEDTIPDALHDVFLSPRNVREKAYDSMFHFLRTHP
ncbi:MAG: alpha/beta hydrolase [Muribaculaceae bacterium]|nr:alpha/beta hydrolase [Muribaculaceae bacterium]